MAYATAIDHLFSILGQRLTRATLNVPTLILSRARDFTVPFSKRADAGLVSPRPSFFTPGDEKVSPRITLMGADERQYPCHPRNPR
jgi:hypothetical protein